MTTDETNVTETAAPPAFEDQDTPAAAEAPAASGANFMDSLASRPPLLKKGLYRGVVEKLEDRDTKAGAQIAITCSLHGLPSGEPMYDEEGGKVDNGKRVSGNYWIQPGQAGPRVRTPMEVAITKKRLLMALYNVPFGKTGDSIVAGWPAEQKLKSWDDMAPLKPYERWVGRRVLVLVGVNSDGDRNELREIQAESTPLKSPKK